MKITHSKVSASTEINASEAAVVIPSPFDEYFKIISDAELVEWTGYDDTSSVVEQVPGYEMKHIAWAIPKPEYDEMLADAGLGEVELVSEAGGVPFLAYAVNDRVYPVSESDLEMAGVLDTEEDQEYIEDLMNRDLEASEDVEASDDKYMSGYYVTPDITESDLDFAAEQLAKYLQRRNLDQITTEDVIEELRSMSDLWDEYWAYGLRTKEEQVAFLNDLLNRLAAYGIDNVVNNTFDNIKGAVDTGLEYWYYTRHGMGPGTIPSGVQVLDWYEEGYKTWLKLDKMLTTQELDDYDIQEEFPPAGVITHNGDEIEACDQIEGATAEDIQKAMDEYAAKTDELGKQLDDLQNDVINKANGKKKSGLLSKFRNKFAAAATNVEKVAEDDNSISYVISSDDIEEHDPEEDEDFMDQPEQEYSSAETAINGKQGKLPAVFSKADIPNGALVLDYGGGTVESEAVAQNYLDQFDAKEMLYDPFNQTAEHNRAVINELKQNGGADVAVCSNVLNVIKEEEVRLDLLKKISKLLKPGATAYISVYEGSGKGDGGATQNGKSYQNKRKLSTYLDEVQAVFPEATRKGAVIIAPNTQVAASTDVSASVDIDSIDIDALKKEIEEGCIEYLCGPQGGFKRPGEPREDKYDMYADEFFVVEVKKDDEKVVVEVRAELSYEGMENMSAILDQIVAQYDEDAYFEMVEPGIMEAYMWDTNADIYSATDVTAGKFDRYNEEVTRREEDRRLDPPEYDEPVDENPDVVDSQFSFDIEVQVDDNYTWEVIDGDPLYHADLLDDYGISEEEMLENFKDVVEWHIPSDPGKYALKGRIKLAYEKDLDGNYDFASYLSTVTDLELVNTGKVESSTTVEAAMSEEELDDAILNNKPFDLESFKKWKNPVDPDAILAEDVQVGDIIDNEVDASEVNLGTVFKVLAINDPAESWIDYTFKCEVLQHDGGMQNVEDGSIIYLHYAEGDPVGYIDYYSTYNDAEEE